MPEVKAGKVIKAVRLPDEVLGWLVKRADYNGATISAEINIAVREKMEREAIKQERSLALAGAA